MQIYKKNIYDDFELDVMKPEILFIVKYIKLNINWLIVFLMNAILNI